MFRRILAPVAALVLLAGCTAAAPQPEPAWQQVDLPTGVRPASLAATGTELLVGGVTPTEPGPRLLRVQAGAVTGEVEPVTSDPYAQVADLVDVTAAGDDVYAIGRAIGGAHANPRLSVWDGSLASDRLVSRPQEFFTFGGHDAGPLLGTVVVDGEPVIVGSRTTATGSRGVLWTRTGTTWTQQDRDVAALASSPDRELGFSGVDTLGPLVVIAGDELGLAGGLTQSPTAFAGTVTGEWQSVHLPVPDLPAVGGQLSRATGVACPATGETCWFTGWARGHALAWPVTIAADGTLAAGTPAALPGDPPSDTDASARVTLADGHPAVLTNAASPTLQYGCPDGWRTLPAPPGVAVALTAAGDALYAVAGDALWRLPTPSC
ncbi:MAG: hypothetical protein KDB60_04690 [Propionibacteriaceae bacterium]|nr:hypothetical protein [Propionibacteriaceae bacterium]